MIDIKAMVEQLPDHLTHSSQAHGMAELGQRLGHLAAQGMVLAVREWFEDYPHITQGFELHMNSTRSIEPYPAEELTPQTLAAARDLSERIMRANIFDDQDTPTHILVLMNAFKWDRDHAEHMLGAVAQVQGNIEGSVLFAQADQARLETRTGQAQAPVGKLRL